MRDMKGKKIFVWVAALCLVWAGCEQMGGSVSMLEEPGPSNEEEGEVPVYVKLAAIEIATLPDNLYYRAGNKFDPTGLEVDGVYYRYIGYDEEPPPEAEPDEAVTERLPRSEYRITAPGASAAGGRSYDVTVRCGDLPPQTFSVYISAASATAYLVTEELANPNEIKKNYELGQAFDTSNLTVTATYSDGAKESVPGASCQVVNYDRRKRGAQTVTLRLNNKTLIGAENIPVTVKVPQTATLTANSINNSIGYIGWKDKNRSDYYRPVFIKGMQLTHENLYLRVNAKVNGETVTLSAQNGGITPADTITGYNYNTAGLQHPKLNIDDAECGLEVFYMDAEPEVYFDYGFMRHNRDTNGTGLSAGKYYVKQGGTLVLSPIRFLIGYNADYSPVSGTTYSWSVSGVSYTATASGEFYSFTPPIVGTYDVTVSVTGRDFVTGQPVTKIASTQVVSFDGTVVDSPAKGFDGKPLKNFSPGQFTKGGTGHGWSLGTFGGYEMWPAGASKITITGNGFQNWDEPGIVWVQADENKNGRPDEMWYEITGSQETSIYKSQIKRRYAIKHFAYDASTKTTEYGQPVGRTFWTDSAGQCGVMVTGWPDEWGVDKAADGVWVTYTGTVIPLEGTLSGYVDVYNAKEGQTMTVEISKAICADGSKAPINSISFVKVQTAVFSYGGPFGDVSTEIVRATGISGDQSGGFPNPLGSVK
jgi:hypothetical protein